MLELPINGFWKPYFFSNTNSTKPNGNLAVKNYRNDQVILIFCN